MEGEREVDREGGVGVERWAGKGERGEANFVTYCSRTISLGRDVDNHKVQGQLQGAQQVQPGDG